MEVFKSGYGYDRYIAHPDLESTGWSSIEEFDAYVECEGQCNSATLSHVVPRKIFESIGERNLDYRSLRSYTPPSDGFTNDDFLKFVESRPKGYEFTDKWRSILTVDQLSMNDGEHKQAWIDILDRFFSASYRLKDEIEDEDEEVIENRGRNYFVFRLIELNEFLEYSKSGETLEDFLNRCSREVSEVCADLNFKNYGSNSSLILQSSLVNADFENENNCSLLIKMDSDQLHQLFIFLSDFTLKFYSHIQPIEWAFDCDLVIFMQIHEVLMNTLSISNERSRAGELIVELLINHNDFKDYFKSKDYDSKVFREFERLANDSRSFISFLALDVLVESMAFDDLSMSEVFKFFNNLIRFGLAKRRINFIQDLHVFYALKNGLINPKRFIEFFLNLEAPEDFTHKNKVLSIEFFEEISDPEVPLDWALSASGINI